MKVTVRRCLQVHYIEIESALCRDREWTTHILMCVHTYCTYETKTNGYIRVFRREYESICTVVYSICESEAVIPRSQAGGDFRHRGAAQSSKQGIRTPNLKM